MAGRRLGVIGLGNRGGRMARRLVDAGHPVLGFDVRADRAAAAGATQADSVARVVRDSDCVFLSLPDSRVVEAVLEVLNASSGVNFATRNRFPRIAEGDYLEGGLTGSLMTKDIVAYVDLVHELGVPPLNASGPLASFGLANNLGYADQISNRVVDAIGDVAGGVRLYDPT